MTNLPTYWQSDIDGLNNIKKLYHDKPHVVAEVDRALEDLSKRYRAWIYPEVVRRLDYLV